jgi:hypothetical protein
MRETGEGGGFIVEAGDDILKVEGFEDEQDVAVRAEELEVAVAIAERGEGADDGAEAGAIELDDVFEIEQDVPGAGVNEFAELGAEDVVGTADGGLALEVQDGDAGGLPDCDLQAHCAPPERAMWPGGIIRVLWGVGRAKVEGILQEAAGAQQWFGCAHHGAAPLRFKA